MKRVPLLIALVLTFSFGLTFAQGGMITGTLSGDTWVDSLGDTYLVPGGNVTFTVHYMNGTGGAVKGMTNGIEVSSTGGFTTPTWDYVAATDICQYFDLVCTFNTFSIDGAGADTIGLATSVMTGPGIADGFDEDVWFITTGGVAEGDELCFDSAYFPPSGTWLWAPGGVPDWGGPYCYVAVLPPNFPPEFTTCPGTYTGSHCDAVSLPLAAWDKEGDVISFDVVTGPGAVTNVVNNADSTADATYEFAPSLADVGTHTVEIEACDDAFADHCSDVNCTFDLNLTNEAPVCTFDDGSGNPDGGYPIGKGNTFTKTLTFDAVDCDPVTGVSVTGVSPAPTGTYGMTGNVFEFATDDADANNLFDFTIEVTDGDATTECHLFVYVLATEPFEVQIEKVHDAIQGMHHTVDVTVNLGSEKLQGFDILVAYDASALTFEEAIEGDVYNECGWEYFTYRYGPDGNCGNGCPSGLLRVVGIAETNNGANHPTCYNPDLAFTLFSLDFLLTNDRTFECMYVPIRFFWMDCGDNSLAYSTQVDPNEVLQGVSRQIFDYDNPIDIADMNTGFPTYTGVQATCFEGDPEKPAPIQFVDFKNGGIDIICADSIDARGDINLNNISNEIADAVLFSNYFVDGLGVFTINMAGQIAATDVNADGLTLSVADLVYLIRVVVGDALPYAKLSTVEASYTVDAGVVAIDKAMGGAYLVAAGNVTPTLLADNMDMKYNFDGTNTHILVYSMEQGQTFQGEFIEAGNIVSAEFATYEGAVAKTVEMPTSYDLAQNYPNPFNPVTNISFSLKQGGDYTLTVYNVTGQVVETFAGTAQAGVTTVTWDAANQASGIYFYKLEVNNFSETKKMVLLK